MLQSQLGVELTGNCIHAVKSRRAVLYFDLGDNGKFV